MKYQTIKTTDFLEQTKFRSDLKKNKGIKEDELRGHIMKALQSYKIFNHEDWNEHTAWLVANADDAQIIHLDEKGLPQTQDDLGQLMAALIRDEDELNVMLGENWENHKLKDWVIEEKEDKEKLVSGFMSFNWEINPSENIWADKELVLSHVMNKTVERSQVFKLIDESLWQETGFVRLIFECEKHAMADALTFLPKKIMMSQSVFDVVKENKFWFSNVWNKYYKEISLTNPEKDNTGLAQRIHSEILTNKELVTHLLPDNLRLFWHLPQDMKEDNSVMIEMLRKSSKLSLSMSSGSFLSELSENYFSKKENVALFFSHAESYLIESLNKYPQIWSHWIENKDEVLHYCSKTIHNLARFFANMPEQMRTDKDIALLMTENNKDCYRYIDVSLKSDPDIMANYVKKENQNNLPYLDKNHIFALDLDKHHDLIIDIVKRTSLLKDALAPESWKKNEELISYMGLGYKSFYSDEEQKQLLKRPDFFVNLINNATYLNFSDLPGAVRALSEVSLAYIQKQKRNNPSGAIDLNYIPTRLWANRKFALEALSLSQDALKHVPKNFWNDQAFILGALGLVDSGKISTYTFRDNAPAQILQFFDNYGISSGFKPFFASYCLKNKLDNNLPEHDEPDRPKVKI
jgi:predicted DNA-binding protein (MmcQ/YjbR family)